MSAAKCVCAACGATTAWRTTKTRSVGNNAQKVETVAESRLPLNWCCEFYARDPDDPAKNRILCPKCTVKQKVQRGTVRFKAVDR